jgi:hypothetical protein
MSLVYLWNRLMRRAAARRRQQARCAPALARWCFLPRLRFCVKLWDVTTATQAGKALVPIGEVPFP